ncbi:alpha-mannosidase [Paenibacillus sp. UNC451MF]|uniref:alpha-mannosidase n=1 Tax=Paenibacillus sp. UNC451MF TaxID=1449063 RepID=UPI00048BC166|nr:alpha-mannosidase [Paenibacillus sp. UNC451MF]
MLLAYEKLARRLREFDKFRYNHERAIPKYSFWIDEQAEVAALPPEDAEWREISIGERWGGWDVTAWLKTEVVLPAEWEGRAVLGLFDFGKTGDGHNWGFESLLYLNGSPFQGVGTNHKEVFFPKELIGQKVELLFKVWSGLSGGRGRVEQWHQLQKSSLAVLETEADDLYFTGTAALQTVKLLHESRWERQAILKALDRAFLLIQYRYPGSAAFYESVSEANHRLKDELEQIPKLHEVTVRCIGHTHIDVAWLWRLKHTREKAARSFSTVLRLMEQFPEYTFLQTQPQLYDDLERDYPELFARIKERVKEGRWEAAGAMWLESDCNIPSGESLVRQLMYGMRYFEQTFGVQCEYLWLPDVFGYSWALPQILKKSGLRYFMTTKISWNVYNRFPHDTFYWRGIDGSEILTHYITTPDPGMKEDAFPKSYTYNGQVLPETVNGIWNNYRDKEVNDELLLSFGWGDGGGGPTRTMLEMRRRLEQMPGLPKVTTGRADSFFRQLEQRVKETDRYVHRWDGELYLELHRGTYTSQAYVKKMNRHMENKLRDAEIVSTFIGTAAGFGAYPKKQLDESWKIVLRNQFHDILPGSSIPEVYEDCHVEYAEAERLADQSLQGSLESLAAGIQSRNDPGWFIVNTLPWERDELIELPWEESYAGKQFLDSAGNKLLAVRVEGGAQGDTLRIRVKSIPSMGYTTFHVAERSSEENHENQSSTNVPSEKPMTIDLGSRSAATPFYEIEWNAAGQLSRLYDKRSQRELIADGEVANHFDVHEDKPTAHDNWEIDIFYYEKQYAITDLQSMEVIEHNSLQSVIRCVWHYGETVIKQDMTLYADNPRIDFSTWVDWQEREQLLKVAFPVRVRAAAATHEIQFGNVQRPTHWNTSWDFARFETCAHRWIDLSERGCGISLLNDCKYGHDVRDHVMRLTLIKSSNMPDPTCDLGEHTFTYSLLPHEGDWFGAGTVQQAHRLNIPVTVMALPNQGKSGKEALPAELSFISCSGDHVVIDTIKRAEDSDDWIVRCYEYAGKRGEVGFTTHFTLGQVEEVNLLEREGQRVEHQDQHFRAFFTPYELKTFRIRVAKKE